MTPIPDTPETQGKECKASESGKHEWAPDTKVWCVWCSALKGEPVCPVCDGPVDPADSKCMTCDIKLKPREPQKDETSRCTYQPGCTCPRCKHKLVASEHVIEVYEPTAKWPRVVFCPHETPEPREPHAALIAERFAPYVVHIKPCPLSGFTLKDAAAYRLRGNEVDDCRCGLDGLLALKGA